jgi:hypothetical protein
MRHEMWKSIKPLNLARIKKFSPTQTTRRVLLLPVLLACAASLVAQSAPAAGKWKVVRSANGGNQAAGNVLLATAALSSTNVLTQCWRSLYQGQGKSQAPVVVLFVEVI